MLRSRDPRTHGLLYCSRIGQHYIGLIRIKVIYVLLYSLIQNKEDQTFLNFPRTEHWWLVEERPEGNPSKAPWQLQRLVSNPWFIKPNTGFLLNMNFPVYGYAYLKKKKLHSLQNSSLLPACTAHKTTLSNFSYFIEKEFSLCFIISHNNEKETYHQWRRYLLTSNQPTNNNTSQFFCFIFFLFSKVNLSKLSATPDRQNRTFRTLSISTLKALLL